MFPWKNILNAYFPSKTGAQNHRKHRTKQRCRKGMLKTTLVPHSEQVQQKLETKGLALAKNVNSDCSLKLKAAGQISQQITRGEVLIKNKTSEVPQLRQANSECQVWGHNHVSLDNVELHVRYSGYASEVNDHLHHHWHLWERHWAKCLMLFYFILHNSTRSMWLLFYWRSENNLPKATQLSVAGCSVPIQDQFYSSPRKLGTADSPAESTESHHPQPWRSVL